MQEQTRSLRRTLFAVMSIAWLAGWYVHLDQKRNLALNQVPACEQKSGLWNRFKDFAVGCQAEAREKTANAEAIVSQGMTFAVFATIGIFFVSGTLASAIVSRQTAAAEARQERKDALRAAARDATLVTENMGARRAVGRSECIKRLGLVEEYLMLLDDPSQQDNRVLIKQNVLTELRELTAKYPLGDLRALARNDEAIKMKVDRLATSLRTHALDSSDLEILSSAAK